MKAFKFTQLSAKGQQTNEWVTRFKIEAAAEAKNFGAGDNVRTFGVWIVKKNRCLFIEFPKENASGVEFFNELGGKKHNQYQLFTVAVLLASRLVLPLKSIRGRIPKAYPRAIGWPKNHIQKVPIFGTWPGGFEKTIMKSWPKRLKVFWRVPTKLSKAKQSTLVFAGETRSTSVEEGLQREPIDGREVNRKQRKFACFLVRFLGIKDK